MAISISNWEILVILQIINNYRKLYFYLTLQYKYSGLDNILNSYDVYEDEVILQSASRGHNTHPDWSPRNVVPEVEFLVVRSVCDKTF